MVKDLNERFAIADKLRFELDDHDMERAYIKTAAAEATIYLNGAHITHYQPAGQNPLLFLSPKSNFARGKAIRGGIPLIYPWFGPKKDDPTAPMHGFARTSQWQIESTNETGDVIELVFRLDPNLRYQVQVGKSLDLSLDVKNTSTTPLLFEEAFHTYLSISDIRATLIEGLAGATFIDKTDQMKRKIDEHEVLRLEAETDRVYLNTTSTCKIYDLAARRRITIEKKNSSTTVVWNPWSEKTKKMTDLAPEDWPHFICIETANAADNAITLALGGVHTISASLHADAFDALPLFVNLKGPIPAAKRRAG
jgi:glucose-6-phosphate 1-epimerase